jgi:hypothetical protein
MKQPRFDILIQGRILNRISKCEATPEEYNQLAADLMPSVAARGLRFANYLGYGSVFHDTKSMTTEDLTWFTQEVERVAGGSFHFDGTITIQDCDRLTLEEKRGD